ncbi:MAG: arsenate reductase ArsC [Phycisphaerae bacterium]|nr:arsenate reductase ArsC [Phycisphaerae bacterium]
MLQKLRVLILCTGNSARSQMAEGFWRRLGGDRWEVFSAGVDPKGVNPVAVQVMAEAGVDISAQRSKNVTEFHGQPFDLVVTVCDNAAAACPSFPGAKCRVHWPFEDPPHRPVADEAQLSAWRRVRDRIRTRISEYLRQQQGAGEGE